MADTNDPAHEMAREDAAAIRAACDTIEAGDVAGGLAELRALAASLENDW